MWQLPSIRLGLLEFVGQNGKGIVTRICFRNPFYLLVLIMAPSLVLPARSSYGQIFTPLYHFSQLNCETCFDNPDVAEPTASLIFLSNFLDGTAEIGGSSGNGTVFAVNTDCT